MKRIIIIAGILVLAFFGYRMYQAGQQGVPLAFFGYRMYQAGQQGVPQGITSNQSPSGDVEADVCIGSAEFCQGVADAKKLEIENAQKQYELLLQSQQPTPAPTLSPEDVANQVAENKAKTNVLITALWAAVVIAILYAVVWGLYQLYWHYRVKTPNEEVATDIRAKFSPDGKHGIVVAHIKPNPNEYDSVSQYMVVDIGAMGTQIVHIDGKGVAHQLKLSDYVGSHVAMSHAISDASSRDQARMLLATVLDGWSKGTATQLNALGDFAAKWKGTSASQRRTSIRHAPSKMRRFEKGEAAATDKTDPGNTNTTWT